MTVKSIVLTKLASVKDLETIFQGSRFQIGALRSTTGKCETRKFLNELSLDRRRKMLARLEFIANNGLPSNPEQYRLVGDGLAEIKTHGVRLFAFQDGALLIVVTHGMQKGTRKVQEREIQRAKDLMELYLKEKRK